MTARPVNRCGLLTGTDDNALKNVTTARAAGADVRTFVDPIGCGTPAGTTRER